MENKKSLYWNIGRDDLSNQDRSKYRKKSFNQRTSKEIVRIGNKVKILEVLSSSNKSLNMRQISMLTSIERPTLCRRIAELMKCGKVKIHKYAPCPISKYDKVGFYTIDINQK